MRLEAGKDTGNVQVSADGVGTKCRSLESNFVCLGKDGDRDKVRFVNKITRVCVYVPHFTSVLHTSAFFFVFCFGEAMY